jgi:hypothetical protein
MSSERQSLDLASASGQSGELSGWEQHLADVRSRGGFARQRQLSGGVWLIEAYHAGSKQARFAFARSQGVDR